MNNVEKIPFNSRKCKIKIAVSNSQQSKLNCYVKEHWEEKKNTLKSVPSL